MVVVFDAFGTLIKRADRRINPWRRLVGGDRREFLTRDVSIEVFCQELGLEHLAPIVRRELDAEISALELFDDVLPTLKLLRGRCFRVGLCSNLAAPYGPAVHDLLPDLEAHIFSYQVGAVKPEPAIYETVCRAMRCRPRDVLFIGDSQRADFEGPTAFGMQARHLDREAGQCLTDLLTAR